MPKMTLKDGWIILEVHGITVIVPEEEEITDARVEVQVGNKRVFIENVEGELDVTEPETFTTTAELTDEMIQELCEMTTRDEAGRHFTTWSEHYVQLEEMGLISIHRPVHETGIPYSLEYWSVEVTPKGLEVVEQNPELHP